MYRLRGLGASSTPDLISAAAVKYGVPPSLALAVAQRESGLNQGAVGTSGELGVFQLMPGTAAQLGVNPSDLTQNVDGGVRYLSQMYNQFGDWKTALEAYNGGPGNVSRGTVSSAAQSYADAILGAPGADFTSIPFDTGSVIDSGVPVDSSVAGLSPVAWLALGIAGIGIVWAVSR
jgi:soluble lytic murein transglycosylase-like protein